METVDYTIRSVPSDLDAALRKMAFQKSTSVDHLVLDLLKQGVEDSSPSGASGDLDFVIGSWKQDPAIDQALAEFEVIDKELWK